ncbi:UDP-N-acetylmuramate--L-alanine ligase [Rhodocytophaga rosea]|uniref:UDP-N-acetylmuramate--L-alanine ligase n=1 Tax=Rhodocytophaga rosea TaxID=2704465 RepID=A0A6C0GMR3_9BACT|nr:UDP-N-acetylmuramate--L-alanine ligase [Rhodocytophaga rosea]QHT69328.1 UDP-N-acetylmuramate--L-alanine ligase [Rhodocytophaga rosea]
MNVANVSSVYFLGIGGIGMSALARWFHANGCFVAGYDRTPTTLTNQLQQEGIGVHFEDEIGLIPPVFLKKSEENLIIYTPAIPKNHKGYTFFQENGYELKKRSQVLGWLTKNMFTVAVAGTHGKTTTSSMVAHILKASGKNCAAFLGGITANYNTNLLINDPASADAPVVVVEADEYDRSFLTLFPDIAVVNSVDADHLDIYGNADSVVSSYQEFINQIKPAGSLFIKQGLPLQAPKDKSVQVFDFSRTQPAYFRAENVHIADGSFVFDVTSADISLKDIHLQVPGFHNVENALVAMAASIQAGVTPEQAKQAIETYKGVKRRFEYIVKNPYLVYIDDYAHHPAEIEALLRSVRALYPAKKITAVFQPHLYSRTRDFAEGFASSLSLADQVILLDIYPARELPIPGVSSQMLLEKITSSEKMLCGKNNLLDELNKMSIEVLVTIGAGDIDQLIIPIKEYFNNKLSVNQ